MNKYLRQPEKIIDLHGRTTSEADSILQELLKKDGALHVRVIVGKGNHSKDGPVLRDFVKNRLTSRRIRYSQSKIQDGGEGALEVFFGK